MMMEIKRSVVLYWTVLVAFLASVDGASGVLSIPEPEIDCAFHCQNPSASDFFSIMCRCLMPTDLLPSPICIRPRGCPTCECLCPFTGCPPSCPYGYTSESDSQGCQVCKCKPKKPVCPVLRCLPCLYGYQNLKDANGCDTCPCKLSLCGPGPVCDNYCPGGRVLNSRGCPTCTCNLEVSFHL